MTDPSDEDRIGPYDSERGASRDCRVVYEAAHRSPRRNVMQETTYVRLLDECRRSGVELGAYDREILYQLSDGPPPTVQVVLGIVARAYDSGHERGAHLGYRVACVWDEENDR
ncbi:MAG: hypothetical protein ACRDN9_07930 [Streptosporangiaceae bacterium]